MGILSNYKIIDKKACKLQILIKMFIKIYIYIYVNLHNFFESYK